MKLLDNMSWLVWLLPAVVLAKVALFLTRFYWHRYVLSKIPSPPGAFFIGNLNRVVNGDAESIFEFMRECSRDYWPIYRFRTFFVTTINFLRPEDLEIILSAPKHMKKSKIYEFLSSWLGEGLLTSFGVKWQTRRKIITPAFHFGMLEKFVGVFNEETDKLVKQLEQQSELCEEFNVVPFITQMTLQTIGETAMGLQNLDPEVQTDYKKAIYRLGKLFLSRLTKPWLRIPWVYYLSEVGQEEKVLVDKLHKFAYKVIEDRERKLNESSDKIDFSYSGRKRLALLDLLITEKNNEGTIDIEGIREEVDTFMFEGHDTTSAALSFLLLSLALHPKIQDEVLDEINTILPENSPPPSVATLQLLKYTEMVIKESLRLYPSVPFISRIASEDFSTFDGHHIPKGTILHMHIFDLHRDPRIYPEPLKFDPERFLQENSRTRHPYAYLPFSAGPRNCIGQRFAMLELKAVLCGVLRRFRLESSLSTEQLQFTVDLILRTNTEISIKFVKR